MAKSVFQKCNLGKIRAEGLEERPSEERAGQLMQPSRPGPGDGGESLTGGDFQN